ncbi:MAG: 2-oxoacid:acceptor oxidoreductase subunit alpha [Candidatus Hermodarchaeota archaeon]
MGKDVFTFIVGGRAGEGVKKAGTTAALCFARGGRYIFQMDDYMSLIKGGHNFSVVSTATRPITSQYMKANLVVALDKRSYEMHHKHLAEGGIIVYNSTAIKEEVEGLGIPLTEEARKYTRWQLRLGVGAVTILSAAIGMKKEDLKKFIEREYPDAKNNVPYAETIYDLVYPKIGNKFELPKRGSNKNFPILTGNQAIALGAVAGGLDIYIAYPMTPATSILHFLAQYGKELGVATVHPENEIAVINLAIGVTVTGAKSMVGTSGGGFALMQEAFSLAGMVESPLLCVLSSRPGPATGVPTYTGQGDLNMALNQGHGEFPRLVASPGSIEEAFYLTAEMLDILWRFQTPGILLTEKHLSESTMTVDLDVERIKMVKPPMHDKGSYKRYLDTENGVSPLLFPPSNEIIKWNSYEHDELGITTEEPENIIKMCNKRHRKQEAMIDYLKKIRTVNTYGDTGPIIFTYGSTTLSVLEALKVGGIDAKVVQPVYLEPLPVWELTQYKDNKIIVVEQSSTGQFATLLKEKVGLEPKAVIKRYDGRPFDPSELAAKLKEVI